MDRRELLTTLTLGAGCIAGCTGAEDETGEDGSGVTTEISTTSQANQDSSDETSTEVEETTTETEQAQSANAQVGEIVEGDNLSMVIKSVEKTTEIGEFQEAGGGNTFVVAELAVKNTTSQDYLNFSGFLQTQLKDSQDYTYEQTVAVTGNTFQGGQLAPGEVSNGDIVYEVPEDASGLTLQFDFQAFSFSEFDRVTIDLSSEASSIGSLSQNLQVDVHNLGESISYENVTVSANSIEFAESLGDFAEAEDGMEYAIIDITTENGTQEELSISMLLQMKMKDGQGNSYGINITALSSLDRPYNESQPIAPGESRRGQVAYEVPQDASQLYWTFEFTLWVEGDKTFWQVR